MKLAKQLGEPPRDVAARVAEKLGDAGGLLAAAEVSGPGFVNLAFSPEALAAWATRALADPRLGVGRPDRADDHGRLLGAQRRQGDARRAPALDRHRRRDRAHAGVRRPPRDPHEPPGRLGHPVRDAHPAHAGHEHPAPEGLRGARDALPRGQGALRRRPRVRRQRAPAGRRAAGRRPGDDRAVAGPRGRLAGAHQPPLRAARRDADRRGRDRRELLQRPARRASSRRCSRRASRSRATARSRSSPSGSRTRTARPRC